MSGVTRRTALCLLGSGLALLAGCSDAESVEEDRSSTDATDEEATDDDNDDGDEQESIQTGDLPAFASALVDSDSDEESYFFGAIDLETLATAFGSDEIDGSTDDSDPDDEGDTPTDPLLVNPLLVALLGFFSLVGLGFTPAAQLQDANDRSDGEGSLVTVGETTILVGSYDLEGVVRDATAGGYEEISREDDRAVFFDADSRQAVGATESLFVFAFENDSNPEFDPVAAVERHVEGAVGERALKHETDDDFEWVLRAGETSGIVLGLYGNGEPLRADEVAEEDSLESDDGDDEGALDFDESPYEGATGAVQHLDIVTDEDRPFASAVFAYASEDDVDEDLLESTLGTQAESVSFTRDGSAVRVEAAYGEEALEDVE